MIINVNDKEVNVASVVSTTIHKNGKSYPAFKFIFEGEISAEDIAALSSGNISIDGNEHEGYTTLGEISMIVGKITTAEEERDELETELEEYVEQVAVILPALDDETALSAIGLFPVWAEGVAYKIDERISYHDVLYRVVQNHTSQADWKPDITPALYVEVTVSESGYDIWVQPTGAHDAYNAGDIVEYEGVLYRSLIDGNTTVPGAGSQYWEVYTT